MSEQLHIRVVTEDGSLWATIDEFPGVFATGDDLAELTASLEEGLALVLERDGQVPVVSLEFEPQAIETTATAELEYA